MGDNNIKVLLVDDHALVRKSLANLMAEEEGFQVVGSAGNALEALDLAREAQPDIILMDVNMPGCDGLHATRLIKKAIPEINIIMLTVSDDDENLFDAIKAGARGYLLKNIEPDELFDYLRRAYRGEAVFSGRIASRILDEFAKRDNAIQESSSGQELTPREKEVLSLVAKGYTNRDIADTLKISENTVKKHLSNIMEKLHLENRVQAAAYALQEGLVREDDIENMQ